MNLLLLLSAMLSALTGAVSGGRAITAPQTVCAASIATHAQSGTVRAIAVRPVQALATLVVMARATMVQADPILATTPLYASRRRE